MSKNNYLKKGSAGSTTWTTGGAARYLGFLILFLMSMAFSEGCKKETIIQPPASDGKPGTVTPVIPVTPTVDVDFRKLGYGIDITDEYIDNVATRFKVIDVAGLYILSKDRIIIDVISKSYTDFVAGENILNYSQGYSGKFNLDIAKGLFKGNISYRDTSTFRSDIIMATYFLFVPTLHLKFNADIELLKKYLNPVFVHDLETQSPEYIIQHYGTCVMTDNIYGARFEATYTAQTTSMDKKVIATAGLSTSLTDFFGLPLDAGLDGSTTRAYSKLATNQHLTYRTLGGNSSIALVGQINVGPTVPAQIQIAQWQGSITPENSQLVNIGSRDGLVWLYKLVSDPSKAAALKAATLAYLDANQIRMIDPPIGISEYYDYTNGRHAYNSAKIPTIHGNYTYVGQPFQGYSQATSGASLVNEFYNAAKNIWAYSTQSSPDMDGFTYAQPAFWAFKTQKAGTVPLYQFYYEKKSNKNLYYDTYYSTSNAIPGGDPSWHYVSIVCYVYP